MKILIADDDIDVLSALRVVLESEGYQVVCANDGEQALTAALSERPSLLVVDILMPGLDGFQLMRAMQQHGTLKDTPVIFYTGSYFDDKDKELARRLGVARFLQKPLSPAEIIVTIRQVLEEQPHAGKKSDLALEDQPVRIKPYNQALIQKLKSSSVRIDRALVSLETIIDSIGDGVIVIDRNYTVLRANAAAVASVGLGKEEVIGLKCYEIFHKQQAPCNGSSVQCPHNDIFRRGEPRVKVIHTHPSANGEDRHVELTASAVGNGNGEIVAMVESFRDIMDSRTEDQLVKLVKRLNEAQMHLKQMAITDELTGLHNRRYIVERLEHEFHRAKRSGRPLGLIMLDVDHFKQINDAYGHLFGDVVLRVIGARIKTRLRRHDMLGRVGGEEFLVVCPDSSLEDSILVAERIRNAVNGEAISDGIHRVSVALSAGVTAQSEEDVTSDKTLSRADTALYKAKEEGRNRVVVL